MAAELFKSTLSQFKITLDEDAVEYIGGMLDDMTLNDPEEVRESTESFLKDANINDMARNNFYKTLFSNASPKKAIASKQGPVLLSEKVATTPQRKADMKVSFSLKKI